MFLFHLFHYLFFCLFGTPGAGTGSRAKSGGGFDKDQREIFEKRRLELLALGKVSTSVDYSCCCY